MEIIVSRNGAEHPQFVTKKPKESPKFIAESAQFKG
jgi:hypothetical protein